MLPTRRSSRLLRQIKCTTNQLFLLLVGLQLLVIGMVLFGTNIVLFRGRKGQHNSHSSLLSVLSSSSNNNDETTRKQSVFKPMVEDPHSGSNVRFGCQDTTQQEHTIHIQLHILAWRRPAQLRTLLEQLETAEYSTDDSTTPLINTTHIPLFVHLDGNASPGAVAAAQAAPWTHGPRQVQLADRNRGLRSMWLETIGAAAAKAADESEITTTTVLLVLEDDVMVSPAYFQWTRAVLQQYARHPSCRDADLVGFSLSPLKMQEGRKPFRRWDAQEALGVRNNNLHRHLAYLSNVPSSWGAAYFADQWRHFDAFVQERMRPPHYNVSEELLLRRVDYSEYRMSPPVLHIPNDARSNVWPKSWKRFMVDFMYARGYVMLYPNLPGEMGLATALQEDGEHVGRSTTTTKKNPRVAELVPQRTVDFAATGNLPRYGDLAVFDLFLQPTTKQELAEKGEAFLRSVYQRCPECTELLKVWTKPGFHLDNDRKSLTDVDNHRPGMLASLFPSPMRLGCIADQYTSTAAAALRYEPSPTAEKFLLFEPQYGANNQLHAVVEAYFWAKALHRRLVVPPLFMPRVSAFANRTDLGIPMERFFRLVDFRHNKKQAKRLDTHPALPTISYAEFSQLLGGSSSMQPWRILRVTRSAIFDGSARVLLPDTPIVSLRPFLEETITVDALQNSLGGCDDQVLAFDGLYFAGLNGVDIRAILPDVLQTTASVDALVRSIQRDLVQELGSSEYACFHVRLGDFVDMCTTMTNLDRESSVSQTVSSSYLNTFAKFSCVLRPNEVAAFIRSKNLPAFVMSDSPEELQLTLNEVPVRAVSSDWTDKLIRSNMAGDTSDAELQALSLLVDQQLCADSTYAFLNRFSTVSQRVLSLRRRRDFEFFRPLGTNGDVKEET